MINYFELLLPYFGKSAIAIPIYILSLFVICGSYIFCKMTGPSDFISNIIVYLPILSSLIMCVFSFYSKNFWPTLFIFGALNFILVGLSIQCLQVSMSDKSGIGVIVFTGFVIGMIFTGTALGKLVYFAIRKFIS